jgi:molybdate transport system substrate-binding protein
MGTIIQQIAISIVHSSVIVMLISCGAGDNRENDKKNKTKSEQTILVFAGASLTNVITEIADSFEIKHNIAVKLNFASSGTLARQMKQGVVPDIYISASKKWADYADSLGFFLPNHKKEIASNDLVLIAPLNSKYDLDKIDSSLNFNYLLGDKRISVGDPAHVPAGKYAKQSLEYYGYYKCLENKLLPAKDVRSALMVVELEESPLGIVYRTDALKSDKVKILSSFPDKSHESIVYIAGLCKSQTSAKDFFIWLNSDKTIQIWEKHGFRNL